MIPIIAIIKRGDHGPQVANLQNALLALQKHEIIRQRITEGLKAERAKSLFGPSTGQLVMYFQVQQGLGDNLRDVGVEEKTAGKLNEWLKKLGLLDIPKSGARHEKLNASYELTVTAPTLFSEDFICPQCGGRDRGRFCSHCAACSSSRHTTSERWPPRGPRIHTPGQRAGRS